MKYTRVFVAASMTAAVCVPSVAFAANAPVSLDQASAAIALAFVISEVLALLPLRPKGLVHGAILLLRAALENVS